MVFSSARPFSKLPPIILSMFMKRPTPLVMKLYFPIIAQVIVVPDENINPEHKILLFLLLPNSGQLRGQLVERRAPALVLHVALGNGQRRAAANRDPGFVAAHGIERDGIEHFLRKIGTHSKIG